MKRQLVQGVNPSTGAWARRSPRRLMMLVVACAMLALTAGTAQAAVSVSSFQVHPSSTQAGGLPNLRLIITSLGNRRNNTVEDLTLALAPGLSIAPAAVPPCSASQFQADNCAPRRGSAPPR